MCVCIYIYIPYTALQNLVWARRYMCSIIPIPLVTHQNLVANVALHDRWHWYLVANRTRTAIMSTSRPTWGIVKIMVPFWVPKLGPVLGPVL